MKCLISADQINEAVADLAARVTREYQDKPLTIIGVLTGSLMLLADLVRQVPLPLKVGLIQASSYRGRVTNPSELVTGIRQIPNLSGRHVLLIDDIFDTGKTLAKVLAELETENVASLKSAVLLWKEGRQQVDLRPDHHCFKIPDQFVVGYGLDYDDEYRQLPYIAVLEEHELGPQPSKT